MTTIAFDGKIMAADSRMVGDFIEPADAAKVHRIKGSLYGAAGTAESCELFFDWVRDGKPGEKPKVGSDFEALEYDGKVLLWYGEKVRGVKLGSPNAIGSGSKFAQAAMVCGKTARQAVKVAMQLDPGTGGRVRALSLGHKG